MISFLFCVFASLGLFVLVSLALSGRSPALRYMMAVTLALCRPFRSLEKWSSLWTLWKVSRAI